MRQVIVAPAEEGGYYATVPSLPGCISQGETWEEAIANVRQAIASFLRTLDEAGEPIPEDNLDRAIIVVNSAESNR